MTQQVLDFKARLMNATAPLQLTAAQLRHCRVHSTCDRAPKERGRCVALLTFRCMNTAGLAMPCDASQVLLLLLSLYSLV
jgi:hypothetical protein